MKDYLNISETAEKLSISEKTIRNLIFNKKFPVPFIKFNGSIRIPVKGLENYLKKIEVNQKINSIIQNQKEGKPL